jgi:hypothetical protein
MEPEGSIPNSQELFNCSYPEPDNIPQYPSNPTLKDPSYYYPTTYVFLVASIPLGFPPTTYSCYMPRPTHPPRLNYSNNTSRRVQIMKLFIMQFSDTAVKYEPEEIN